MLLHRTSNRLGQLLVEGLFVIELAINEVLKSLCKERLVLSLRQRFHLGPPVVVILLFKGWAPRGLFVVSMVLGALES